MPAALPAALQHDARLASAVLHVVEAGVLAELEDAERVVVAGLRHGRVMAFAALDDQAVIAGPGLMQGGGVVAALLVDLGVVLPFLPFSCSTKE